MQVSFVFSAYCRKSSLDSPGTVPTVCGAGRELDAGLCYPACQSGYHGVPAFWRKMLEAR